MSQTAIKGHASQGAERRTYKRYAVDLDALVSADKNQWLKCSIRDYCLGGMLVVYADEEAAQPGVRLSANDLVTIDFSLALDGIIKALTQKCRITRMVAGGFGLVFVNPDPSFIETLKEFTKITVVPQSPQGRGRPSARLTTKVRKAVSICQRAVNTELPAVYREIFHRSRKALLNFAGRDPHTNLGQNAIYDDVQLLESVWDKKESLFLGYLHKKIVQTVHTETGALIGGSAEARYQLALVEQNEFEDWLCITDLAIRIQEEHRYALYVLSQQLNSLASSGAEGTEMPLAPNVFGAAIREILQPLSVGADTQHIIFNQATNVLAEKLGDFYAHLSEELKGNNTITDTQVVATQNGPPSDDGFMYPDPTPQFLTEQTENDIPHKPLEASFSEADEAPLNQAELADLLQRIQQDQPGLTESGFAGSSATPPAPRDNATNAPDTADASPATEAEPNERIEKTGKLLEILQQDEQVSATVIPWIRSLSQPLLKALIADPHFFNKRHHPLRKIFNQLEHLATYIDREDQSQIGTLVDPIDGLVEQVVNNRQDNEDVLRQVSSQLADIEAQCVREYEYNVEQVVLAFEGLQRANHAQQAVRDELNRQLSGQQIPRIITDLLEGGWLLLLQRTYVREGAEGSTWKQYLFVLERLLQRLTKPQQAESQYGQEGLELYRVVEYSIESVSLDPFRRKRLLNTLKNLLVDDCQHPCDMQPDTMPYRPLTAHGVSGFETNQGASPEPLAPEGVSNSTWNEVLEQSRDLLEGNRFNFAVADGSTRSYRLVWIGDQNSRYVFVNHRGQKAEEFGLAQISAKIHAGELTLQPETGTPLIERLAAAILEDDEE